MCDTFQEVFLEYHCKIGIEISFSQSVRRECRWEKQLRVKVLAKAWSCKRSFQPSGRAGKYPSIINIDCPSSDSTSGMVVKLNHLVRNSLWAWKKILRQINWSNFFAIILHWKKWFKIQNVRFLFHCLGKKKDPVAWKLDNACSQGELIFYHSATETCPSHLSNTLNTPMKQNKIATVGITAMLLIGYYMP